MYPLPHKQLVHHCARDGGRNARVRSLRPTLTSKRRCQLLDYCCA